MKLNETIERKVIDYTLKLWFLNPENGADEICKRFDTYLGACKDCGVIQNKQCYSTDFVDVAFPYFKDKDFIGAIQKILELLREVTKPEEVEDD